MLLDVLQAEGDDPGCLLVGDVPGFDPAVELLAPRELGHRLLFFPRQQHTSRYFLTVVLGFDLAVELLAPCEPGHHVLVFSRQQHMSRSIQTFQGRVPALEDLRARGHALRHLSILQEEI